MYIIYLISNMMTYLQYRGPEFVQHLSLQHIFLLYKTERNVTPLENLFMTEIAWLCSLWTTLTSCTSFNLLIKLSAFGWLIFETPVKPVITDEEPQMKKLLLCIAVGNTFHVAIATKPGSYEDLALIIPNETLLVSVWENRNCVRIGLAQVHWCAGRRHDDISRFHKDIDPWPMTEMWYRLERFLMGSNQGKDSMYYTSQ